MNIYINKRLFSLPIINQLGNLISAYNKDLEEHKTASENNLNSYKDWLCQDSVATFLDYIIEENSDEGNTKADRVKYLTERFYLEKGTNYVIKELKDNKNFKITFSSITLNNEKITVRIENMPDELDFDKLCSRMVDFFSALLFFNDIEVLVDTVNLKVVDESKPQYAKGAEEYEYDIWQSSQS